MTKVMAFGTFDTLHKGHVSYLTQAKACGDELVVIVARDKTVQKIKGKAPKLSQEERLKRVSVLEQVDKAVLGNEHDFLKVVEDLKPDIVCLGYDQDSLNLEDRYPQVTVRRLQPLEPHCYKSSLLQ